MLWLLITNKTAWSGGLRRMRSPLLSFGKWKALPHIDSVIYDFKMFGFFIFLPFFFLGGGGFITEARQIHNSQSLALSGHDKGCHSGGFECNAAAF